MSLPSAAVGRVLDCTCGKFLKKHGDTLKADGLQVGADVFLCGGFASDGKVRLVGADIGGDLNVNHAQFDSGGSLTLERAKVKGGFFWRGWNAELNLTNASTGALYDDKRSWPKNGNLKLDGFVYTRIAEGPREAECRLDWIEQQWPDDKHVEFRPQPYQQLAKVLREAGDNVGARRVLIGMENSRRKYGKLGFFAWVWRWIFRVGIGYGYRPWYALLWGIGVILLGTVLFCRGYGAGEITPTDKEAYSSFETYPPKEQHGEPPWYYQKFSALVAVDTFLPIINLGQKRPLDAESALGGWGKWLRRYLWVHIGLGWLLTTLFVAGLTPIVRSG